MIFSSNKNCFLVIALAVFAPLRTLATSSDETVHEKAFDVIISSVESDVEKGRLIQKTLQALNILVKHGAKELREAGFENEAADWLNSWQTNVFSRDLGDHEPLVQWLADYYSWLEKRLGRRTLEITGLNDILVFNSGIPVAFHVNGWHGDDWDSVEYQKHFVPLSGSITYWICYSACSVSAPPLVGYACGTMAQVPKYAMQKWVAPGLSDRVYKKFRRQ